MKLIDRLTPIRIARASGVLAAGLAWTVLPAADDSEKLTAFLCLFVATLLDAAVVYSLRRRKNRFAASAWFALTSLVLFVALADHMNGGLLAALLARITPVVALSLPRASSAKSDHALPALPLRWAWASTLIVWAGEMTVVFLSGVKDRDMLRNGALAAASTLVLFLFLALFSRFGRLRWTSIPVALLITLAFSPNRRFVDSDDLRLTLFAAGTVIFVAAFDWLRHPRTARGRFARTAGLTFVLAAIPPLAAAPHQVLRFDALLQALVWAASFGLTSAIAPRDGGIALASLRGIVWPKQGSRLRAAMIPMIMFAFLIPASLIFREAEVTVILAVFAAIAVSFSLLRLRFLRALSAYIFIGEAIFVAGFVAKELRLELPMALAGTAAIWLIARWASVLIAGTPRKLRITFEPTPRASLALGGLGAAAFAIALVSALPEDGSWRSSLISDLAGPVTWLDAGPFVPPQLPREPDQTQAIAGTVAIDPLGRGTWIVDEERDEVALMSPDGKRASFEVGAWPEQLIVSSAGRVFVSCRQAGRVFVIEPDFSMSSFEAGAEPRGLALDEGAHRLYVGLVTGRALIAADTRSLSVVEERPLDAEPRVLAKTPRGVAVLPARGGEVLFASVDLRALRRVALSTPGRESWRGEALVPIGDELGVVYTAVNTGLSTPVPSGGYGGGSSEPVNTFVAFLDRGQPAVYPARAHWRQLFSISDVTGAAWRGGKLYLASRGTDTVTACDLSRESFPCEAAIATGSGLTGVAATADGSILSLAAFDRDLVVRRLTEQAATRTSIGKGVLSEQVAQGRRLFHRATERKLTGSTIACATCHPDGREDGLVWRLKGTRRQTPWLAARLAETAPYNWQGTSPTLVENIHQTVERLGGQGIAEEDARALSAYLLHGLRTPVRPKIPAADRALIAQGERIFESEAVGCARCHDRGRAFTDGATYDVGSLGEKELAEMRAVDPQAKKEDMDVPSLLYVGLSAPYFHDGSQRSLEDLIAEDGDKMGDTSALTRDERRALAAYLRSL